VLRSIRVWFPKHTRKNRKIPPNPISRHTRQILNSSPINPIQSHEKKKSNLVVGSRRRGVAIGSTRGSHWRRHRCRSWWGRASPPPLPLVVILRVERAPSLPLLTVGRAPSLLSWFGKCRRCSRWGSTPLAHRCERERGVSGEVETGRRREPRDRSEVGRRFERRRVTTR
jgi:hypothetical protein